MALGHGGLAAALSGCQRTATAPDFRYTILDGSTRDSAALRGRPLLVQFWATTCSICMAEMPTLVELYRTRAPKGLQLLAVAVQDDPPARVSLVAEARRWPFEIAIDNTGAIARAFGEVRATPTAFLIDARGLIDRHWVGAVDPEVRQRRIDGLLGTA